MIVPLMAAVAGTCGGKAGSLGVLLRGGLPVPDGFVVPYDVYRSAVRKPGGRDAIASRPLGPALTAALGDALAGLGAAPVAVRSSASNEDTAESSAAGLHESFLGMRGVDAVSRAVRACWGSLDSPRALGAVSGELAMAVLVQRLVDAEVSGVMFTGEVTRIEASWGLGPSVVGGLVTPDAYEVGGDGRVSRTVADKRTRLDRYGGRLVERDVPVDMRSAAALDDVTAIRLAGLGRRIATVFGGPQDIEWAVADGRIWIVQARPVTAALPLFSGAPTGAPTGALAGTPGSRGTATGAARIVRGPADFARVRPGDILVCPFTDPAWTPLLRVVAGVVTETGGVLSHAAIVAREQSIPAILGIRDATRDIHDGALITIDGSTGLVTIP
ncbi:PEP-utilizing enzyme [Nonomuraea sp. NBC_01738]|uniref:PEP/pyruvate-binding domain-containing protein n=1 Tax=Nonomuraea sp. NBC_01738 TaxID=2976003 RepID=UPI002E0E315B|nr:PEP-utilizing enzyme [Nonomuraea sp. NBC_01738]